MKNACKNLALGIILLASINAIPSLAQPYTDTLNWMGNWKDQDMRETFVEEIAQNYRELHPETYLNLKYPVEIFGEKSNTEIAWSIAFMITTKNYEWDIINLNTATYQLVAENLGDPNWGMKYLVDFGDIEGFTDAHKSFILEKPQFKQQTSGIFTGPLIEGYYTPLWYNEDVADKIGIKIKNTGMTFDDFKGYIKAVCEYNKKNDENIAAIYESFDFRTIGKYLFQHFFVTKLGDYNKVTSENNEAEKIQTLKELLLELEDLSQYKPLGEGYDTNQWFNTRNLVLEDNYLFYVAGSWMYSHWNGLDKEKVQKMIPVELPAFNEIDYYMGAYIPTWAVFKGSPNKFKAINLLMGICNPWVANKWIGYAKAPTGLKSSAKVETKEGDPYSEFNNYINNKYKGQIYKWEDTKYIFGSQSNVTSHFLFELITKILSGQSSADSVNRLLNIDGE